MNFTDTRIIDPIMSIGVAVFILCGAMKNLAAVLDIFLEKTPKNIDLDEIKRELLKIEGVAGVHHVHVRSIDGYNNYATLHVVVVDKYSHALKEEIKHELKHLGVGHSTVELELKGEECDAKKCEPVGYEAGHHHHHH